MTEELELAGKESIDTAGMQNIFQSAPQILDTNTASREKACTAGEALLKNAEAVGMSDKLDEQMSIFVQRAKKTVDTMNEKRKPFTQLIQAVQKKFTGLEKEVGEIIKDVQKKRDDYASEKIAAQKERERIERERLERERVTIQLRKSIETRISNSFISDLTEAKKLLFEKFNALTVNGIEATRKEIASFSENFVYDAPKPEGSKKTVAFSGLTFTIDEITAISNECISSLSEAFKAQYRSEISALKRELTDKLPSKLRELQEIERSSAEERERLERERLERERLEQERLEREAKEAAEAAASEAELRATAETINAIVESEVSIETKPDVKEGYDIEIKKSGGWLLVVQFWYEKEGKTLDNAKIAKVTFDRMKRFCEAYALKNEEKIVSPLIEYKPVYKAK
jgi:hypothetical protein